MSVTRPMPTDRNVYRASVIANTDGDTFRGRLEVLPTLFHEGRVRLARCNGPEIATPEGKIAAAFTAAWLAGAPWPIATALHFATLNAPQYPLLIQVLGLDNYGRILGEVYRTVDGRNLSDDLLSAGMASPMRLSAQVVTP